MVHLFVRISLIAVGLLAVVLGGMVLLARPAPSHSWFSGFTQYPLVIAHADDTGIGLWPGDTMLFLERSAELGVDVLEMNVTMSRDGRIVLMHDTTVDRTTNGAGRVADLTLAALEQLEVGGNWTPDGGASYPYRGAGLRIPTLDDVFTRFPEYPMVVEIKQTDPPMAEPLCALIQRYAMEKAVIVASFNDATLTEFRQACPDVATAAGANEVRNLVLLSFAALDRTVSPNYAALQVPLASGDITVVRPGFVQAAHRRGLQVHAWTINDPDEMRRLIAMGVDGIMTDRPDVLLEILGR